MHSTWEGLDKRTVTEMSCLRKWFWSCFSLIWKRTWPECTIRWVLGGSGRQFVSLLSRDDHYKLCKVTLLSVRITILYPVSFVLQPHHHSLTLRTAPPLIFMKLKMTEGFVPEDFRFLFSNSDSLSLVRQWWLEFIVVRYFRHKMLFKMVCCILILTKAVKGKPVTENSESLSTWVLTNELEKPCFSIQMEVTVMRWYRVHINSQIITSDLLSAQQVHSTQHGDLQNSSVRSDIQCISLPSRGRGKIRAYSSQLSQTFYFPVPHLGVELWRRSSAEEYHISLRHQ